MKSLFLFACLALILGCDKQVELHRFDKYAHGEGTILTFSSTLNTERFSIVKIVNGTYEDSRSGTCGKPPITSHEYQAVYINPVNSLMTPPEYVPVTSDDCERYPALKEGQLISSFVGTFNGAEYNTINWLDEFYGRIIKYDRQYPRITLVTREFINVFEYNVPNGNRLSTIYYSTKDGFVGYVLKTGEVFELTDP